MYKAWSPERVAVELRFACWANWDFISAARFKNERIFRFSARECLEKAGAFNLAQNNAE